MCEMCAYVGRKKAAAPVLLEYGKRVEGLWSGYCTGIGVQDADGVLRMHKTLGCSKYWEERFSLSSLPGSVGFFHSRTGFPGMAGDARYAHPFLASDESGMLVSQGALGIYAGQSGSIRTIGNALLAQGRRFSSADKLDTDRFQELNDGSRVHMSDIVNEYASSLLQQCGDPIEAIRKTGLDILEESVTLFLFKEFPGHLYVLNMNQRLCAYLHEDGVSLSSCALAFGDEKVNIIELPGNSIIDVTADSLHIETLSEATQVFSTVPPGLQDAFLRWVEDTPDTLLAHVMDHVLKLRYPEGVLRHVPTHEIFEQLYYDGKVKINHREYPGIGREASIRSEISIKQ